jgi:hypothetical protein
MARKFLAALLRLARRSHVNVPTHAAFYQLMRIIEAR